MAFERLTETAMPFEFERFRLRSNLSQQVSTSQCKYRLRVSDAVPCNAVQIKIIARLFGEGHPCPC
jgi:hypothetical protein